MDSFLSQLLFSASITGPICLMLLLGVILKRFRMIDDSFIDGASKLVFQVTLPALLFLSIVKSDHDFSASAGLITFGIIANVLFFLFTSYSTKKIFRNPDDQGVIIQGGFRANTAIIALAYVANAYGDDGVVQAAIYVAPMTVLYNILAVIALTPKGNSKGIEAWTLIIRTITRNPLVLSILAGFLFTALSIPVPKMVQDAGQYFANMTLPLALLCTGGTLNMRSLKDDKKSTWFSTGYRLILAPLFITGAALMAGFRGVPLGVIFFMSGAPTAAASYVMARAMGGNVSLAANIIALTTIGSLLSCTVGIFVLTAFTLM
ncbi:transporter [Vibrio sp. HA2012]|uniref:AEC family transporter n=1 Tax=Vibrio sp. HA2012 TaxID=1971595 RepID=UPI000C2CA17F|nr:AEC family transporter [Vibrio sp. HA2012]PJC86908.1 transporter [Vibrio sp. HA2012]